MSSFTSPLIVEPQPNGKYWTVVRKFTYRIGRRFSRRRISVPTGFDTDFASVPRVIWWMLPWWAKYNKSGVIHDWLYDIKKVMGVPITRKQADDIWLEAMLVDFRTHQSGKVMAYLEYFTVRLFAWLAWRRN